MLDHDGRLLHCLPAARRLLLFRRHRDYRHLGLPLPPARSHVAWSPTGSRADLELGALKHRPQSPPPAQSVSLRCAKRGGAHTWSGGGVPGHNHSAPGGGGGRRSQGTTILLAARGRHGEPQTRPPALAEGRGLDSSETSLASYRRFCKPPSGSIAWTTTHKPHPRRHTCSLETADQSQTKPTA